MTYHQNELAALMSDLDESGIKPWAAELPVPGRSSGRPYTESTTLRSSFSDTATRDATEARMVIGIDFGTTYTGVAYAAMRGSDCDLRDINVQVNWPGHMDEKVPSVVSYSRPPHLEWGYVLSKDSIAMVHTKLELSLQPLRGEMEQTVQVLDGMKNLDFDKMRQLFGTREVPAYSHKSPEEIVTDYLTKVFQHVKEDLEAIGDNVQQLIPTDLVITVPCGCSYESKNATFRAISDAGFNHLNFPNLKDRMFITEPEAAAAYTARWFNEEEDEHDFLEVNEYFILCDAGGGTVDAVAYRVKQLLPVLTLEQVGSPTGGKFGSIFINHAFKKFLRERLKEADYKMLDPDLDIDRPGGYAPETPAMRTLMEIFDKKKKFFKKSTENIEIELGEVSDAFENVDVHGLVYQGLLTMTSAHMESFFDTCVAQIIGLIKHHIRQIHKLRSNRPKNLFLVGGFAESKYLEHEINHFLKVEKLGMTLRRPDKSWTAVVRGAVVCGIEKTGKEGLIATTACQNNYAVCLDQHYDTSQHAGQASAEIGGDTFARHQLRWLLKKGDLVLHNEALKVGMNFAVRFKDKKRPVDVRIYRSKKPDAELPTLRSNAENEILESCVLRIDPTQIDFRRSSASMKEQSQPQATIALELFLVYDPENLKTGQKLTAQLKWEDKPLSEQSVVYP